MIKTEDLFDHYKKVIVWGAGNGFTKYYENGYDISYIVDSDMSKWGRNISGLSVEPPQEILREDVDTTAVVICSVFETEIYNQARHMGIRCDIYSAKMLFPNPFSDNSYYALPEFIEDKPFTGSYSIEKNTQILLALMKAHEIKKNVISPGGTNICFVSSIQSDPFFEIYSSSDERSAAYIACGLAAESGEPVAINCTGATASRNYMPGLTEAYYRKLPILAITCSQYLGKIGHNNPQVTDRIHLPTDVAKLSVQLPVIRTGQDQWCCEANVNHALIELRRHGCGPVHINLMTEFRNDRSIKALPAVKVIRHISYNDPLPVIESGRIGILAAAHKRWSDELTASVEAFCEKYNAVVLCDQTSNYRGKYHVLAPLLLTQKVVAEKESSFDLLIHIGDITGAYMKINAKQIWRVNPDGEIRDTFTRLRYVFEMEEQEFFIKYARLEISADKYFGDGIQAERWQKRYQELYSKIPELLYSNKWVAKETAPLIPEDSILYLGILDSLRSWNLYEVHRSVTVYANTGGFGIEGGMSSLLGCSLNNPEKLCFGVFGDLGFFCDMNVLGNRHLGKNLRIMIVNNGSGAEFYAKNSFYSALFGKTVGKYCAAEGHFGNKSKQLVRDLARNLGFDYMSAETKEEYRAVVKAFTNPVIGEKPMIIEIFTNSWDEAEQREIIETLGQEN